MSDTNDMRSEFELWIRTAWFIDPKKSEVEAARAAWQAATERATAIERERCAMVCYFVGGKDTDFEAHDCAAAIRQGGAG